MRERALRLLVETVTEHEEAHAMTLRAGMARDYAEYRQHVGFLQGMQIIREACEAIEKKLNGDDERP